MSIAKSGHCPAPAQWPIRPGPRYKTGDPYLCSAWHMIRNRRVAPIIAAAAVPFLWAHAVAGPPYISDDPETTDFQHYEIYTYTDGTMTRDGSGGEAGIDFNYGAGPNL